LAAGPGLVSKDSDRSARGSAFSGVLRELIETHGAREL
jgi:hypothetical protein